MKKILFLFLLAGLISCKKVPTFHTENILDVAHPDFVMPAVNAMNAAVNEDGFIRLNWSVKRQGLQFIDGFRINISAIDTNSFSEGTIVVADKENFRLSYSYVTPIKYNSIKAYIKIRSYNDTDTESDVNYSKARFDTIKYQNSTSELLLSPFNRIKKVRFQWNFTGNEDIQIEIFEIDSASGLSKVIHTGPASEEEKVMSIEDFPTGGVEYQFRLFDEISSTSFYDFEIIYETQDFDFIMGEFRDDEELLRPVYDRSLVGFDSFDVNVYEMVNFETMDGTSEIVHVDKVTFPKSENWASIKNLDTEKAYLVNVNLVSGDFRSEIRTDTLFYNYSPVNIKVYPSGSASRGNHTSDLSPDGSRLVYRSGVSLSKSSELVLYDLQSNQQIHGDLDNLSGVSRARFMKLDGTNEVLVAATRYAFLIFDPETGSQLETIPKFSNDRGTWTAIDFVKTGTNKLIIASILDSQISTAKPTVRLIKWDHQKKEQSTFFYTWADQTGIDLEYSPVDNQIYFHYLKEFQYWKSYTQIFDTDSFNEGIRIDHDFKQSVISLGNNATQMLSFGTELLRFSASDLTSLSYPDIFLVPTIPLFYVETAKNTDFTCLAYSVFWKDMVRCISMDSREKFFTYEASDQIYGLHLTDDAKTLFVFFKDHFVSMNFKKKWLNRF